MKKQKGITLIALVITIIVLLILAAIVINLVLGDGGVIQNGIKSRFMSCYTSVEEGVELYKADKKMLTFIQSLDVENKEEVLPVTTALDLVQKQSINTLVEEVERISGKPISQVKLYWIDKEKIKSSVSHQYVIDMETEQIYDYEGERFFGQTHHAIERPVEEVAFIPDPTPDDIDDNKIYTIEDLVRFSNRTNGVGQDAYSYAGETVTLMNNLDFQKEESYENAQRTDFGDVNGDGTTEALIVELSKGKGFTPIGQFSKFFMGTFDGNNLSINNLYIKTNSTAGLFGVIQDAIIKNVKLKNVNIEGSTTGGVTGFTSTQSLITNCSVEMGTILGSGYVGGIVGQHYANDIIDCWNTATITSTTSSNSTGGIVGFIVGDQNEECILSNVCNLGDINGKGKEVGGIVGRIGDQKITLMKDCYNTGKIVINTNDGNSSDFSTGGLIGFAGCSIKKVENCYNKGSIETTGYAGGIIGNYYGSYNSSYNTQFINCYNKGAIKTTGYAGGLMGQCYRIISLEECYNLGKMESNSYAGGLVAYTTTNIEKIENCYNEAEIIGSNSGGLLGHSVSTIGNIVECHNTGKITNGGGLIGYIDREINQIVNCYNTGIIESTGSVNSGGLIGYAYLHIELMQNLRNTANVTADTGSAGGIIGNTGNYAGGGNKKKIIDCHNTGNIVSNGDAGGLFGGIYAAEDMSNCDNEGEVKGKNYVGGLIGSSNTIYNMTTCKNKGKVTSTSSYAGGIGGYLYSVKNVSNLENLADITGASSTGGICGYSYGFTTASNCKNTGNITGNGDYTAGIVARGGSIGTLENTYNDGLVNGNKYVAGIVAQADSANKIENCYNGRNITGTEYAAGIVGYTNTINECNKVYNTGDVTALNCGGIIGRYIAPQITNAYNVGNITGTGEGKVGGLVGESTGSITITNAYSTGNVSTGTYVGSILGSANYMNLTNTYYSSGEVSCANITNSSSVDNSVKKSYSDMQTDAFAATLGSEVWTRNTKKNDGLPIFK
ncbi:MAG: hypothetical protein J6A04_00520 [Clostridia bacterium]|nr:hypothetical protein [Clostridia bacterium]